MEKRVIKNSYFINTAISILKKRQFILYHKPTTSCNCRCEFCDFWKNENTVDSVSTERIIEIFKEGWKKGLTTYSLWGGEPLMVSDLGVWLKSAKDIGYKTSLCTSGYLLEERCEDIKDNIDIILLSLESTYEKQDNIRRTPGLFNRIIRGVEKFKRESNTKIKIWSNINKLNANAIPDILKFAIKYNLVVEFFPSNVFSDYNEGIIFSPEEKRQVFSNLILLKKRGYPVNNSVEALKIMRDGSAHVCNMARNAIHLDSFGNLTPCEPRFVTDMEGYGNILKDGLSKIHDKDIYDENIKRLSSCDKCLFPCIAESANNIYYRGVRRFADFITNKDR